MELVALASQAEGCLGVIQGAPQQVPSTGQVLEEGSLLIFQTVESSLQAYGNFMASHVDAQSPHQPQRQR